MRHQILVDFTDPHTLATTCNKWFTASRTVELSRWLFSRALKETDDGLARFVAVAQAFEVLARELAPHKPMPKSRLREAVDVIQKALGDTFEESFVERIAHLIRSSNRSSLPAALHHMLSGVAQRHQLGTDDDIKVFSKMVGDTRNAVVHMTDDDEGKLTEAFRQVNKLSLQLCFWYALFQADQMGLNIRNARTFLWNNRNARHGLPNDVLEMG